MKDGLFSRACLAVFAISIFIVDAEAAQVVNAGDFGLSEGKDATYAVFQALEKCRETGARKLVIPIVVENSSGNGIQESARSRTDSLCAILSPFSATEQNIVTILHIISLLRS